MSFIATSMRKKRQKRCENSFRANVYSWVNQSKRKAAGEMMLWFRNKLMQTEYEEAKNKNCTL